MNFEYVWPNPFSIHAFSKPKLAYEKGAFNHK